MFCPPELAGKRGWDQHPLPDFAFVVDFGGEGAMVIPTNASLTVRLCVIWHWLSTHSPFKNLTHICLALALGFGAAAALCALGCVTVRAASDLTDVDGTDVGVRPSFSAAATFAYPASFHRVKASFWASAKSRHCKWPAL